MADSVNSKFPTLWKHQANAHERIRHGARDGHLHQIMCGPTGSGKLVSGLNIIYQAILKGIPCALMCDRIALIDQTSAAADRFGMPHGVIQAGHWRTNSKEMFQICSAQTAAKRKLPQFGVLVIDEVQTVYKSWVDYLTENKVHVIGLSATPFTKGLGKHFTNLVVSATMHELVENGVLVPMRVFSCTKPNMVGAAVVNGEWTEEAAAERGLQILGDVVTEWRERCANKKTFVFGATIKHCEELCRQFNEEGILAAVYTSNTPDDERKDIMTEFRKYDTELKVLLSVEALAKGIDCPDVTCIEEGSLILTDNGMVAIDKLSTGDRVWDGVEFVDHDGPVYMGERDVITYAGLTATPDHLVNTEFGWMPFGECSRRSIAIRTTCIAGAAVGIMEDAFTDSSGTWRRQEEEADGPMRVCSLRNTKNNVHRALQCGFHPVPNVPYSEANTAAGFSREGIWHLEGVESDRDNSTSKCNDYIGSAKVRPHDPMRMSFVRVSEIDVSRQPSVHKRGRVRYMPEDTTSTGMACEPNSGNAGALYKTVAQSLRELWWSWREVLIRVANSLRGMDYSESWAKGAGQQHPSGPDRQQWSLRAWKYQMGVEASEFVQHKAWRPCAEGPQVSHGSPRDQVCRQNFDKPIQRRANVGTDNREIPQAVNKTKRRVWDILNAGPRNSFTCQGLLVHNCICDCRPLRKSLSTFIQMIGRGARSSPDTFKTEFTLLDFSGNIVRFKEDYEDIYFNGLQSLDDGIKLDKKVRDNEDEVREPQKCPSCGSVPFFKRCVACGFEKQSVLTIEHGAGIMREIMVGKKVCAANHADLWAQACTYTREHGKPETAHGRAAHIYRGIVGNYPPKGWSHDTTPSVQITAATLGKIRSEQIRWVKGMQKKELLSGGAK